MKKSVYFSVIASKSLKCSLFDIFRTRLDLKAWSPYQSQGTEAHVCEQVFKAFLLCLGLHIVVSINISQEIFEIDILTTLKPFLEQDYKHVRLLRLYGDQG